MAQVGSNWPGNGLTYPIDYRQVDFRSDAARWLLELADGLGVEKLNLVGGSMGAVAEAINPFLRASNSSWAMA